VAGVVGDVAAVLEPVVAGADVPVPVDDAAPDVASCAAVVTVVTAVSTVLAALVVASVATDVGSAADAEAMGRHATPTATRANMTVRLDHRSLRLTEPTRGTYRPPSRSRMNDRNVESTSIGRA
jgi:hypothetical protein